MVEKNIRTSFNVVIELKSLPLTHHIFVFMTKRNNPRTLEEVIVFMEGIHNQIEYTSPINRK